MSSTEKIIRRHTRPSDEEEGHSPVHDDGSSPEDERPESPFFRRSIIPTQAGLVRFKDRFLRRGKPKVGTIESIKNIVFSSWLNFFIVFIPISWVAHFSNANNPDDPEKTFPFPVTFVFSLLAIVPLERLFDYGGEQMAFYCGKDLGDLVVVTLNNAVEATLAIILLTRCELKLLQSTIIGVVVLHLLLVPGTAFITGGARISHQDLHPHLTELNHTLLTMGVLALLLPAAIFAALDRGDVSLSTATNYIAQDITIRDNFLRMSRGLAIILLAVYICSRIFLHNPPGDDNALTPHPQAPSALLHEEDHLINGEPEVSQWVCIAMLAITIALMAATAEWLVDSIEFVRESGIQEEWFGLILLPIVSFAADGLVSIGNFVRYIVRHVLGWKAPPSTLAKARTIDLSIQFTLFWAPFIVLLGWWTDRPMSLLFDFYEIAALLGSCFLVNYVTADAKTNWAEGFAMVSFYLMIALTSWFYTGQVEIEELLQCVFGAEGAPAE
ncbi:hypothetical protein K435DRAFT_773846 [Dendrothele bispora CBS 962.96]|uniref:Sodium/calcium exchanger membrane region domain-containing protein n=1 Tax=Dendrothele bispora (strain CBS 962.96) TaxID=1314807 RepID=A0A4S8MQT1_DENBC|nr:hypothetical protein K435DRAFT_773846 [Dendrothele bispora CBS 962.96]